VLETLAEKDDQGTAEAQLQQANFNTLKKKKGVGGVGGKGRSTNRGITAAAGQEKKQICACWSCRPNARCKKRFYHSKATVAGDFLFFCLVFLGGGALSWSHKTVVGFFLNR
jgi:hypothetical protein